MLRKPGARRATPRAIGPAASTRITQVTGEAAIAPSAPAPADRYVTAPTLASTINTLIHWSGAAARLAGRGRMSVTKLTDGSEARDEPRGGRPDRARSGRVRLSRRPWLRTPPLTVFASFAAAARTPRRTLCEPCFRVLSHGPTAAPGRTSARRGNGTRGRRRAGMPWESALRRKDGQRGGSRDRRGSGPDRNSVGCARGG